MMRLHTQFAETTSIISAAVGLALLAATAGAEPVMQPFVEHPASETLQRIFAKPAKFEGDLKPTSLTKKAYLSLMAANVNHWLNHLNASGAIIDPVSRGERQYSTPAFALAAALLVAEADRQDLLEPAARAMTFATHQLATGKAADGHGDFYMPMLIHARRILKPLVSADVLAAWDADLRSIEPTRIYNMNLKGMNWNLVSSTGELLRRQDGLVAPDQMKPQWDYLEERLADHAKSFTKFGMYADPGVPLTYDAFARLWLDDMMINGAYDGATAKTIEGFLRNGGLSTLLLLSPAGEWPSGGRSSHHNWCEAQIIAICEIHAKRWIDAGRADIAGAFKRAAHLAYTSMQRWQRSGGELNIIKNRYEPEKRFAYEGYSNHSQYNLLPMAMLAIAYQHADDSIPEQPTPAESSAYVFDLRETFHKVVAAAGGYYVLIDTAADPHYNATGLQRVHRANVAFSPLTDSSTKARGYGKNDGPSQTLVPGLQWRLAEEKSDWKSLGDAFLLDAKKSAAEQRGAVAKVDFVVEKADTSEVAFRLDWTVVGEQFQSLQRYQLSPAGVVVTDTLSGDVPQLSALRLAVPVTVFDGVEESKITLTDHAASVATRGATLTLKCDAVATKISIDPTRSPAHPGLLQPLVLDLSPQVRKLTWSLVLE